MALEGLRTLPESVQFRIFCRRCTDFPIVFREMKGKSAWLITWEDFGCKHWDIKEPKVVAVLPPRLSATMVKVITATVWTVVEELTLSERIAWGVKGMPHDSHLFQPSSRIDSEHFYYGMKPKLYVRKVKNLICESQDGRDIVRWRETPVWTLDSKTGKPIARVNDAEEVWSQPES